jgi:hypothetical protein
MTSQERYTAVNEFLRENKTAIITFTKKDGTIRELFGTLDDAVLPERASNELHKTRLLDWETFTIWDIEAEGWRAFKTANLIKVENA